MATNPLLPRQTGATISVSSVLKNPSVLLEAVGRRAAEKLLAGVLFTPLGQPVVGGGINYTVLTSTSHFLIRDVQERTPGAEYPILQGEELRRLATVTDWGGKVQVLDEESLRNDAISLANRIDQLANTLARQIDRAALAAVEANKIGQDVPGHDWSDLVTVGDPATLTPTSQLPSADLAAAQLFADADDLGVQFDTLVVHPNEAMRLRVAYADRLPTLLDAFGLELFVTPLVEVGSAYAVKRGAVGRIAFEMPLTVEAIPDREHRCTWMQGYVVPAFAVSQPGAVRKITGLAG
ncbi:major capsid protein [Rhodococcus sp. HS-D2]|uniref:major capsid protein n=1 Tax=Rhodococcus sp. HS-D2 TaxID=1384636 RepID=UPI0007D9159A|nr:major capsid protein [Rhodococcus sp. HS-D2]